jgi:hypothetical protein
VFRRFGVRENQEDREFLTSGIRKPRNPKLYFPIEERPAVRVQKTERGKIRTCGSGFIRDSNGESKEPIRLTSWRLNDPFETGRSHAGDPARCADCVNSQLSYK